MIFKKVIDSGGASTGRAGTCGEGKGRGKPLPKELGDLGFSAVALHASRHKASADFYTQTILSSKSRALIPWFCLVEAGVAGEPNPLEISDGCGFVYNKSRGSWGGPIL